MEVATDSGKRRYDKENSDNMVKCARWSLGGGVGTDPPLLADMGLAVLQDEETNNTCIPASSTTTTTTTPSPRPNSKCRSSANSNNGLSLQVLQNVDQNSRIQDASCIANTFENCSDFFMLKRRRLDLLGGDDQFNRMSDEHILAVFQWLPKYMLARCAQVNRRWKRLAFDESLWRRLDLGGKTLRPGVVGRVILRGCNILRLAKAEVESPIFSPQLQHLPSSLLPVVSKLQYLDLSMATVPPEALEEMLSVCHNLKKLSLEHCTLTQGACNYIGNNASLTTLNLAMCYGLSHTFLLSILTRCKKLQCLNLAWTGLTTEDLRMICRRFPPSLERLNLSGCRQTLTDSHVRLLAEQTTNLVELDLSDASYITGNAITSIIKKLHRVEYLAFSRCYTIQPESYIELKTMPNLMFLDVYGIMTENVTSMLKEALPHVKINKYIFSSVARPTVGIRRTSIWCLRVRD